MNTSPRDTAPTHAPHPSALTQDALKTLVGQAALHYVVRGELVGVGTGSTVNKFIDALATIKDQIKGAVSSSVASTERLRALGIPVFDSNEVERLSVYIDGADEIDHQGHMVKAAARRSPAKKSLQRSRTSLSALPTNRSWWTC
jgi:ribose 5-phosphate isomerase A